MKPTAFDNLHPIVSIAYFVAVLGLTMAVVHPAFLIASLVVGITYNAYLKGIAAALGTIAWQLPLLAIIALANPLFTGAGSTELVSILGQPLYLESLVYGACMGCMLMAVLQWFSNASAVVTSDKLMAVTGRFAPVVTLMITMVGRLVPEFLKRGETINDALDACTAAKPSGNPHPLRRALRVVTTLMGWSMEDSLEASDAMQARGWGATTHRTTYRRLRFGGTDAIVLALVLALFSLDVFGAVTVLEHFRFYATIHGDLVGWWLLPHLGLLALPAALEVASRLRWAQESARIDQPDDRLIASHQQKGATR